MTNCCQFYFNFAFKFILRRYTEVAWLPDLKKLALGDNDLYGGAVQVDSIKPELTPPGTRRLKLNCDVLLSTSAFKFNLRRYTTAPFLQSF
jgi:hypothetical protein